MKRFGCIFKQCLAFVPSIYFPSTPSVPVSLIKKCSWLAYNRSSWAPAYNHQGENITWHFFYSYTSHAGLGRSSTRIFLRGGGGGMYGNPFPWSPMASSFYKGKGLGTKLGERLGSLNSRLSSVCIILPSLCTRDLRNKVWLLADYPNSDPLLRKNETKTAGNIHTSLQILLLRVDPFSDPASKIHTHFRPTIFDSSKTMGWCKSIFRSQRNVGVLEESITHLYR